MQWVLVHAGVHPIWKLEDETVKAGSLQLFGDSWEFVPAGRHGSRMNQEVIGMIYSKLIELNGE